ncbi:MAG TPA: dihydroorotase [Flavobacteriales bacterium]|nr:dihydroorotase [Flavobacteriales bacterium]
MNSWLIRNALVADDGRTFMADVLVRTGIIERIATEGIGSARGVQELDARENLLLPGVIDDQVHFREPGLTHKDDIASASAAAAAGGITSFMEMPNTQPQTLTQELLAAKYALGAKLSRVNYSFYMGVSNDNLDEVMRTDPSTVCGLKAFLGSSTGNMLVDDPGTLDRLFRQAHMLLAIHAEDESTIRRNMEVVVARWGDAIPIEEHPRIRSAEACFKSSSSAVALAKEHGTRLHVLHISTAQEVPLFDAGPLEGKRITAEACVHHLWFTDADYPRRGPLLKWNPAVKSTDDRAAIRQGVIDGRIDVIATDHAPHTLEEKSLPYAKCPSGGPLVQHSLVAMLELEREGVLTLAQVVEKLCHAPARMFAVDRRGYIREGYHADLVLIDRGASWTVDRSNLLYKCGWSPFEGQRFSSRVMHTWVNGRSVFADGRVNGDVRGERLLFDR